MTRISYNPPHTSLASLGLLVLRVIVGAGFIVYGLTKIGNPFGWLEPYGIHGVPALLQLMAVVAEVGGGLALILGLLTPLAAALIFCDMIGALVLFVFPHGGNIWINPKGGLTYEKNLFYMGAMVLFFTAGAGRYSLDAFIARSSGRSDRER